MNTDFICLDRDVTTWEWYRNTNTFRVFMHLLLTAKTEINTENNTIPAGVCVCTFRSLEKTLCLSRQTIRTAINNLKATNEITIKENGKTSIITVINWHKYQTNNHIANHKPTTSQPQTNHKKGYKENKNSKERAEIVDYLNQKAGTSFKPTTKDTQQHINARLNEGYFVDDFKTVIDGKYEEWKNTDMQKYLRPSTLFGSKFEGYLNAQHGKAKILQNYQH